MLTIQDVGLEILGDNPRTFYAFCGSEYGVKKKYIEHLTQYYGECIESVDVKSLLDMMSTKRLIPLKPALYVVRYDEEFLASLDDKIQSKISKTKICGTIVCIYDGSDKVTAKLEKYLSNYSVRIDAVSPLFLQKYLQSDFPELPEYFISNVCNICSDYSDAQNICKSASNLTAEELSSLTSDDLMFMFGKQVQSKESQIRRYVAAKNFTRLVKLIEDYSDNIDGLPYTVLSTMIELDKILDNTYVQSDLREFTKYWNHEDVYNMFMNTYQELKKLRSYSSDTYSSLIYLFSLLKFSKIPSVESML